MKKINVLKPLLRLLGVIALLPLSAPAQLVNNGTTMAVTPGALLVINNLSFQNNGPFLQTGGTVTFNGNVPATISGSAAPAFYVLTLDKPGSTLQLQTGITVNSQLLFTNGLLDLNANNIILDAAAQVTGETETSRITGNNGGYVQITLPLNAPAGYNPGNLGAEVTSAQNLGMVTVRRGHQSQTNGFGGGNSILRYYDIMPVNNTALNATLRINYMDAELNGLNEPGLITWKSNNNTVWNDLGFTTRDAGANQVLLSAISQFARFTLSSVNNTLPLTWNSFITQCLGSQVRIGWKTEQEHNTAFFTVRRSTDGRNWTTIATLPAAGYSNMLRTYSYTDAQPVAGKAWYQVQQHDVNGRMGLSPMLLNTCSEEDGLSLYPNPAVHHCWVSIVSNSSDAIIMRLYDSKGLLVQQRRESILAGNNQFELQLQTLAQGMYSLAVSWSDGKTRVVQVKKD